MPDTDLKGSIKLGNYLKHLRLGYGYSLRKVEEKARLSGGEIDNSQLSRYEKGRCYPSFDKLRVLAGIFNVSIQSFSDVVDLESYEELRPEADRFEDLLEAGNEQSLHGNYVHAYAAFQKAVEMVEEEGESGCPDATARLARARYGLARTLLKMGKISLGEYELRNVLRLASGSDPAIIIKTLLQLTNAHAEQGDRFLARLEAEKCLSLARCEEDTLSVAYSLHALGRIAYEEMDYESALQYYRDALTAYEAVEDLAGCLLMKVQIGSA
ncbi:MAG: helix-turn-helix domain-containing protein [Acidobacteriota bacterium]